MNVTSTPTRAPLSPPVPLVTQGIISDEQQAYEKQVQEEKLRRKSDVDRLQELLDADPAEDERTVVNRLLSEGNAGNSDSMILAYIYIGRDPTEVKFNGSLGAMSREWVIEETTGKDLLSQELALRNVKALERELRSRGDSPLIRMAGDRLLSAYVAAGANDYLSTVWYDQYQLSPEHVAALESCDRRFLVTLQAYELAERLENQNKPTKPRAKPASKTADSQGVDAPGGSSHD
jgi:hypothetical protein